MSRKNPFLGDSRIHFPLFDSIWNVDQNDSQAISLTLKADEMFNTIDTLFNFNTNSGVAFTNIYGVSPVDHTRFTRRQESPSASVNVVSRLDFSDFELEQKGTSHHTESTDPIKTICSSLQEDTNENHKCSPVELQQPVESNMVSFTRLHFTPPQSPSISSSILSHEMSLLHVSSSRNQN